MADWNKELDNATKSIVDKTTAVIRKSGPPNKPYCVHSKTGKKLGCFPSRKQAQERLAQIEFFKNK